VRSQLCGGGCSGFLSSSLFPFFLLARRKKKKKKNDRQRALMTDETTKSPLVETAADEHAASGGKVCLLLRRLPTFFVFKKIFSKNFPSNRHAHASFLSVQKKVRGKKTRAKLAE
jgi:hypothetical protein